ncbi:MAG: DinB family protein [Bacteroidia bacterium]|nr:DinB family protein [Bacteroidia bacterium]
MALYVQPPYPEYFGHYFKQLPEVDAPFDALTQQLTTDFAFLEAIPDEKRHHRYGPDKWAVAEVIGHCADAERVFGYRILCFDRGEQASLPGFDENAYVRHARFVDYPLRQTYQELLTARQANLALLRGITQNDMTRVGTANNYPVSIHALVWVLYGHLAHHVAILKERYGL